MVLPAWVEGRSDFPWAKFRPRVFADPPQTRLVLATSCRQLAAPRRDHIVLFLHILAVFSSHAANIRGSLRLEDELSIDFDALRGRIPNAFFSTWISFPWLLGRALIEDHMCAWSLWGLGIRRANFLIGQVS